MAVTAAGVALGTLAAGLAAAAGVVAIGVLRGPSGQDAVAPPRTAVEAPGAADEATSGSADDGGTKGEIVAPSPAPAPRFDLVRVAPDGTAVIAGRAEPGSRVTILGQDGPVAEAEADDAGDFVAVFRTTPGTEPQALTLESEEAGGASATSPDVVVLLPAPPELGATESAVEGVADEATDEPATAAAAAVVLPLAPAAPEAAEASATEPATEAAEASAPEAEPEVAAAVVLRDDDSVEVTPAPGGQAAELNLASISYGETGLVTLAGVGAPGARLRAYVNDSFARDGIVDAEGRWTLDLGDVAAGVYRLRIDALRADGAVEARLETPFQRDFPELAAPGGAERPASIIVQPGNNLWTLARIHYGAGVLYTQIHTANRELIRDPELIYPGQIFVLPEAAPAD